MEIQSLKLIAADADANQLAAELGKNAGDVENLHIACTPEGVVVAGRTTALLFKISFETLWEIRLVDNLAVARLTSLKVAGIPAGRMRGMILKLLRDVVAKQPGVGVFEEEVRVDINEVLKARNFPLRIKLKAITLGAGTITIEV